MSSDLRLSRREFLKGALLAALLVPPFVYSIPHLLVDTIVERPRLRSIRTDVIEESRYDQESYSVYQLSRGTR